MSHKFPAVEQIENPILEVSEEGQRVNTPTSDTPHSSYSLQRARSQTDGGGSLQSIALGSSRNSRYQHESAISTKKVGLFSPS